MEFIDSLEVYPKNTDRISLDVCRTTDAIVVGKQHCGFSSGYKSFVMGKKSAKPYVIEKIFLDRWDEATNTLSATMVNSTEIVQAIEWANTNKGTSLSTRNPANFMKDLIRGKGASNMWPELLKTHRWGAIQVTGDGNIFEFVPYEDGQDDPFPTRFGYHPDVPEHRLQSVSMPLASKALGRDDETYLIQVAVKLAVVETHFALYSPLEVVELNHLQIGIKLRLCEVDSLFAATYIDPVSREKRQLIITAEAKKKRQRILEEQIERQVQAAFNESKVELVVPIAMTATDGGIYLVEFKPVARSEAATFTLELQSEILYKLVPDVQGI